jgi:hypothetical protein
VERSAVFLFGLPALKRTIRVETLSRSAEALLPPHKCGGSHPGTASSRAEYVAFRRLLEERPVRENAAC